MIRYKGLEESVSTFAYLGSTSATYHCIHRRFLSERIAKNETKISVIVPGDASEVADQWEIKETHVAVHRLDILDQSFRVIVGAVLADQQPILTESATKKLNVVLHECLRHMLRGIETEPS